jgi:5-methylcytosine-specific restriction endonuclease McrA
MGWGVSFSFSDEAEKDQFEALAESRGLTLSQFARWCVYRYSRQLENCKRSQTNGQVHFFRSERGREKNDRAICSHEEKVEGCGFFGQRRSLSTYVSLPFTGKAKSCFYCGRPATEREHTVPRAILTAMKDIGIGEIVRGKKLIVPACRECNSLLGSTYQQDLAKRKRFLKARLREKYKSLLARREWTEEELEEISPNLRSQIKSDLERKRALEARLSW